MAVAYLFAGRRVDLLRRRLVGADGATLSLSSRAFDVLVYLIENRDRVVAKDDIMAAVWPNVVVEENNVNQAISSLRKALSDQRESPQFIATIAGRGYRFVAHVEIEDPSAISASREPDPPAIQPSRRHLSRRGVVAGAAGLTLAGAGAVLWRSRPRAPTTRTRSIAVLPFQPLVASDANAPLELGMADTLINRLSRLPEVVVAPFSSVRAYRQSGVDPIAAGRALGVDAVLESNVQIQADRVRLTARLLDVATGSALWSGKFDQPLGDVFALQDALTEQVADALAVQLTRSSREGFRRHDTDNVAAWQLYLQGRFHWGTRTEAGIRQAIDLYRRAIALDPTFALASAGLADAWAVMGVFDIVPPSEAFPPARAAAERAIELDNELAEAQAALGHVLVQGNRDWKRGESQYRRALELKPTYGQAVFWRANNYCYLGRMDDALEHAKRAQAMEPASVAFAANVALIQYFARNYDDAHARLSDLVRAAPQYPLARRFLARVQMVQGDASGAAALLEGHESELAPGSLSDLGRAFALSGNTDAARREIARIEALGTRGFGIGYDLALVHAALGDRDAALASLARGVGDGSQMIGFLNSDPGLDSIRDDARFTAISQQLRLS